MQEETDWFTERLLVLQEGEASFIKRAIYLAIQELIKEQDRRILQGKEELDARLWNPNNW
ncbi:hypothetical protein ACN677_15165 [Lactiplantibacillus paraplantarum]|uniref:hypothetical protein n=1 Tax=Lactiplantibacillus TaxID=2767842 RepID=UPI00034E8D79|nr:MULTISPECIES: hypothetical protein [Lactiplantibacillus]ARO02281.1 hypothetical protein BIZ31_15145 [Lactiplantibacillus plantarum]ARO05253.1 hypothetical protein BIZ32_15320 [Lactiplantibacillus plantarum]EPD23174.1 hypothetical protein L103_14297 [Lactiplantibacillus plantarum IPLA88]MCG0691474.1 hypothetical protein [Lactiplantibacillus plantarum]MCG0942741.1 hypothetical protein [Lactiplantibacillus plantarum]